MKFWQNFGILNILLLPVALLYYLVHLINYNLLQRPKKVDAKVICIGNMIVGGSGKTPYAIFLAKNLLAEGKKVAFISRGYKGKLSSKSDAIKVDTKKHNAYDVGDEPLLLANFAPTYISKNRYFAASLAVKEGAEIIIMDDGMQNNTLHKDELVMIYDAVVGIGNGLLLPAGPLRETLQSVLEKVDRIVVIMEDKYEGEFVLPFIFENVIYLKPVIMNLKKLPKECVLLTGIANSIRVSKMLEHESIKIIKHYDFQDHASFTTDIINKIIATHPSDKLVTTQKDIVRIPINLQKHFTVLEYQLML